MYIFFPRNLQLNTLKSLRIMVSRKKSTTPDKSKDEHVKVEKKAKKPLSSDEEVQAPAKKQKKTAKKQTTPTITPEVEALMEKAWKRAHETKKYVGAHVSMSGGIWTSIQNSMAVGGTAFALFLKNQRQWASKPMEADAIEKFKDMAAKYQFTHILPHGSYLINLCSPDEAMRNKGYDSFLDDLQRCEQLGISLYNFHPGSTTGGDRVKSIENISDCINRAIDATKSVKIVLENSAGQGNSVGSSFEELGEIIAKIKDKSRIGVCLDTCHAFAAGYDLRTQESWNKSMEEFEKHVGFKYLVGVHLNDSKGELNCGKDRHENIGEGHLKLDAFRWLMNDERFNNIPMVLETPEADDLIKGYATEIDLLYSLIKA